MWRKKQAEADEAYESIGQRIAKLRERKSVLIDAMLDRRIDQQSYQMKLDELEQEIGLAEMAQNDARLEQLDVEGLLAFAEHVLSNAERLWLEAGLEQKQRLQKVLSQKV